MIEKLIVLEDIDPVIFYGVNNANMQLIKALYPKLRIVARGNVIKVLGDEEEMCAFEENITKLEKYCAEYNSLKEEVIIDIIKGNAPQAEKSGNVIVFSVTGKPIIPRSENQLKLGRRPAYLYFFDRKLPGDQAGAFHSSELWYEFETLSRGWRPWEEHDWELAEQLSAYWANFVKTGDPNGPGLPPWHPYAGEHKEALVLR